ncbi:hypothetical protein [Puia dinghuensis]|nr:hypothetical protein [Puia dinghuensis]
MQKFMTLALTLLLVCGWASGLAQTLSPAAFISLATKKALEVDSFMTQKGFEKKVFSSNDDFSIVNYSYLAKTDSGAIQRSLHVGWRKKLNILELQYGLWQKKEAVDFIDQLLKQGFTKHTVSTPDIGGNSPSKSVHYQKDRLRIDYEEMDQGEGVKVYIFTIENEHYQP